MERRARHPAAGLACLGSGALVAFSLPPWGWWPLAIVGLALFARLVRTSPARGRFWRGALFSIGWLAPGMGWMWFLTAPGYVLATLIFAVMHGTAVALVPSGRRQVWALPAAFAVVEGLRFCFPFGGVPLASLAISQVAGPLRGVAAVGGAVGLTWLTVQVAAVIALPARRGALVGLLLGAVLLIQAAPSGRPSGESITVAYVQGGGPQGTRAITSDARQVVERHLAATRSLAPGPDLVVWPENVIDVEKFAVSAELAEIAAEARRLGAPFLVGITEEAVGRDGFLNAQVTVTPAGEVTGRYDKVRRVPFGEYMPLRGVLDAIGAPVELVPRDAVAGTGPGYLDTAVGRVGVVISWEVFFGGRARDGVGKGGRLLINPTNGSSYTGTILQSQQVASSRLRAIETGRWVVQVAPTGFSAFVSPDGRVFDRSGVSEAVVRQRTVELRVGRTWYNRIGDIPWVAAAGALVVAALVAARRDKRAERGTVAPPADRR